MCVLSLFSFFLLFSPFPFLFFQVLLQNLPCFSIWTKIQIWGEMAIIYIPGQQDRKLIENYGIAKGQETDRNWIEKGQQLETNKEIKSKGQKRLFLILLYSHLFSILFIFSALHAKPLILPYYGYPAHIVKQCSHLLDPS